jgi:group I intron endonuclease
MGQIYKKSIIYLIKLPNNKKYIGRWIGDFDSLVRRYTVKEYKKGKRPINNAIRKYGVCNVKFFVLETNIDISNDELNKIEIKYIKEYRTLTTQNGYNVSEGGESKDNWTNHPNREILIENIKERLKRHHPRKGVVLSVETKRKIGDKAKLRLSDKKNHPMYGKKQSKESKLKNSESQKGKRIGILSKTWKEPIPKEKLIIAIKNNMSYIKMYDFFNCGQKLIEKSLIYHFGVKSKSKIKELFEI